MTTILGIVASAGDYRCGLRHDGQDHFLASREDPAGARRDLAPVVAELCARVGVVPAAIREVRIDVGPGSYTGLRVAVTFARFLAAFGPCRLRTTTSLALHALAAWRAGTLARDAHVVVVLDARRERFHRARYLCDTTVTPTLPPAAVRFEELGNELRDDDSLLVDPALEGRFLAHPRLAAVRRFALPPLHAGLLFDPALCLTDADASAIEPLYLMGTYVDGD